ncbi:MAG: HEPN domain-containing protein [Euryarchaeota archaeon]|nr:HEPN domain-containing protein [Euryarchaeota archaeon]
MEGTRINDYHNKFKKNNEKAVCLLARAEQDYIAGRLLIIETMLEQGFCLIEQSVEKYLKAWLCLEGINYPLIHNLNNLLDLIITRHPDISNYDWGGLFKILEQRWVAKYDEKYIPLATISTQDLDKIDQMIYEIRKQLPLPADFFDLLLISKMCNNFDVGILWHHQSDALFERNKFFIKT